MMSFFGGKQCRTIVFPIAIVGVVLAFLVTTSIPSLGSDNPNVIHACMKKDKGQLRLVSDLSQCLPSETAIHLASAGCPDEMVKVGPICVDKYEASVWSQPPDAQRKPQGTQFGATSDNYPCSDDGNDCSSGSTMIFAASALGVTPSRFITWFQAQQACANVGKRLLKNGEWQMAAAGAPDHKASPEPDDCNTNTSGPSPTGSRSKCVSSWGVFDMVGNVAEWVEDWIQGNTSPFTPSTGNTGTSYGEDAMFGINPATLQGVNSTNFPVALIRGGAFFIGARAGVFALIARDAPSVSFDGVGFRCAR